MLAAGTSKDGRPVRCTLGLEALQWRGRSRRHTRACLVLPLQKSLPTNNPAYSAAAAPRCACAHIPCRCRDPPAPKPQVSRHHASSNRLPLPPPHEKVQHGAVHGALLGGVHCAVRCAVHCSPAARRCGAAPPRAPACPRRRGWHPTAPAPARAHHPMCVCTAHVCTEHVCAQPMRVVFVHVRAHARSNVCRTCACMRDVWCVWPCSKPRTNHPCAEEASIPCGGRALQPTHCTAHLRPRSRGRPKAAGEQAAAAAGP